MKHTFTQIGGRLSAAALLFALPGVLSASGCVSIDDRPTAIMPKPASTAKPEGGEPGTSGTSGTSGTGGSNSNPGGKSGSSGTATGGTEAGQTGAGGEPANVACGDGFTPTAARLRACVLSLSCSPLKSNNTMSDCVTYGYFTSCESNAMSCQDAQNCSGIAREPATSCGATDKGWHCTGNVAVNCATTTPYSVDCARLGGTCDLFETTQDPARWPCKIKSPATCTQADPEVRTCSGTSYYNCIEGKPYGVNCGAWGSVCIESTPGLANCTDRTVTCDEIGVVSCVGNSVHVCDTSKRFASYDCTPAGTKCYAEGTSTGYCLAPGCKTETDCVEKCVDGKMQICVGNAPYLVDCSKYGLEACVQYTNHLVTGNDYVKCGVAAPAAAK